MSDKSWRKWIDVRSDKVAWIMDKEALNAHRSGEFNTINVIEVVEANAFDQVCQERDELKEKISDLENKLEQITDQFNCDLEDLLDEEEG